MRGTSAGKPSLGLWSSWLFTAAFHRKEETISHSCQNSINSSNYRFEILVALLPFPFYLHAFPPKDPQSWGGRFCWATALQVCKQPQTLLLFSSLHISFHRLMESSEKKHSASNNFLGTPLTRQTLLAGALLSFPFLTLALFLSTCNWDSPWAVELTIFSYGFLNFFSSARTHLGWTVIMSLFHSLVAIWPRIQGMNLLKFRWVANASNTAHHRMSH